MAARRKIISFILCVAIMAAGASVAALFIHWAPAETGAEGAITQERIPNVKVKVLEAALVEDSVTLTGAVHPWEEVTLSAELAGKIERKAVEDGAPVAVNQELFRINSVSLEAKQAELEAQMKWADQEYRRLKAMAREGIGSKQELERAETQRSVAEAGLRTVAIELEKSVIRSPIHGVADKVYKEQNEYVDPGTPLIRIVQVDRVKVVIGIPERDIAYFQVNAPVRVTLSSMKDEVFEGRIYTIAPTAESATHTFLTEVALDNGDGRLRPGMICRATLVRRAYPNSLRVPVFSVVTLNDSRYVFVEKDGVAYQRHVQTGVFLGQEVQVTEGLNPGDRLVVVGQRDLRDGGKVRVQEVLP